MEVIGLDLSIASTGIARRDGRLEVPKYPKGVAGDARLLHLRESVRLAANGAQLAVIEDYFNSPHGTITNLASGMVHGIARAALLGMTVPYVLVAPSKLKRFATGNGNAKKSDMRMAWYRRTGEDVADDNMVDAAWLRQIGLHLAGDRRAVKLPDTHTAALDGLALPARLAA